MNGDDRLRLGSSGVPQETMRPPGSDHLKAGPLQCRPRAPAALSCVRVNDRHQLVDRRGEIPVGRRNGLATLPHYLQAQLDRLARIRHR
jgi:hypothetical protein